MIFFLNNKSSLNWFLKNKLKPPLLKRGERRSESEKSTNNYNRCVYCKKNNRPRKWA